VFDDDASDPFSDMTVLFLLRYTAAPTHSADAIPIVVVTSSRRGVISYDKWATNPTVAVAVTDDGILSGLLWYVAAHGRSTPTPRPPRQNMI